MSAKTQFLKKLQARQASPCTSATRSQADIAAFCQRMAQLQENMAEWLAGAGVSIDSTTVLLSDLLVGSQAFGVPGIQLRYEERAIQFTPLYLYGHGVTGCVEVSLCVAGKRTPLSRLFMRSGKTTGWVCTPVGEFSRPERAFDEEAFFAMIERLLP